MTNVAACIGAGVVGRSWAAVFARAGWKVRLYDNRSAAFDSARKFFVDTASLFRHAGLIQDQQEFLGNIEFTTDLKDALHGCSYAQESVLEDIGVKRELFQEMCRLSPAGTPLASSTSSISGREFLLDLAHSERCLVAHPLNPPHLIPFVEICPTASTAPWVVESVANQFRKIGQTPIVLTKETDGFVANRLQIALLREAFHLIGTGVCSADEVDIAVRNGLAMRWSVTGPMEAAAFNSDGGFVAYMDAYREAMDRIAASIDVRYPLSEGLVARVAQTLAARNGSQTMDERLKDRDQALVDLRKHLGL